MILLRFSHNPVAHSSNILVTKLKECSLHGVTPKLMPINWKSEFRFWLSTVLCPAEKNISTEAS